jgi:hypothetical protein
MDWKILGLRQMVHKLQTFPVTVIEPDGTFTYKPWSRVLVEDLEHIKEIKELWRKYVEDSTN